MEKNYILDGQFRAKWIVQEMLYQPNLHSIWIDQGSHKMQIKTTCALS